MTRKSHRTIGYLRVSTGTQDLRRNRAEVLAFANEKDLGRVEFVEETALGPYGPSPFLSALDPTQI